MEFDWGNFLKAYQAASATRKSIIDSSLIADCIKKMIEDKFVDEKYYQILVIAVSHHILSATSDSEIIKILDSLELKDGATLLKTADSFLVKSTAHSENLATEIAEVEHEMESLHSIRTMSEDMHAAKQEEPTHSSSQDNILTKPVPSAPVAQAPSPDTPRWGSES